MAIGSLIGAVIGANATQSAASTAAGASDRAAQLSADAAAKMREDLAPFRALGGAAGGRLARMFGLVDQSPITYAQPQPQAPQPTGGAAPGELANGYRYIQGEGPSETFPGGTQSVIVDANGNTVAVNPDLGTVARYLTPAQTPAPAPAPVAPSAGSGSSAPGTVAPAGDQFGPFQAPTQFGSFQAPTSFDQVQAQTQYGPLQAQTQFGPFQAQTQNGAFEAPTEFRMTPEQLAATPGYQFALEQGQKAIDNSLAARGGILSGRALKEGARFATGLADNTVRTQAAIFGDNFDRARAAYSANAANFGENYGRARDLFTTNEGVFGNNYNRAQNQYATSEGVFGNNLNRLLNVANTNERIFGNNYNRNQNLYATNEATFGNNYNRAVNSFTTNLNPLMQLLQTGQSAAAQAGAGGISAANAGANSITQGGAISAAGQIAGSNALVGGINSGVNNALYAYGRGWLGGGGGGQGPAVTNAMNSYDWIPY